MFLNIVRLCAVACSATIVCHVLVPGVCQLNRCVYFQWRGFRPVCCSRRGESLGGVSFGGVSLGGYTLEIYTVYQHTTQSFICSFVYGLEKPVFYTLLC